SICPGLTVRARSAERERAAAQAALEAAGSLSPRLEEAAPGLIHLDLDGLQSLFPEGERAIAQALATAAEHVGLRAAVGIAEGKTAARLAARAAAAEVRGPVRSAFRVVEPAEQRAFLAELP